jgi:hypothetical protein
MDRMICAEGERLLEENERLKSDPNAEIPEKLMKRCRKVIAREYAKKHFTSVKQFSVKLFQRVAIVALTGMLFFTGALAASETLRNSTMNLIVEAFEDHTNYRFDGLQEEDFMLEFEVGWIPEGFVLKDQVHGQHSAYTYYTGNNSEALAIDLTAISKSGNTGVDTENAIKENLDIKGRTATLVTKDYLELIIPIPERTQLLVIALWTNDFLIGREEVIRIAENIELF